jgi:hypothetical protein
VPVPTLPHLVLLFFLGGVFLHFIQAGARTLHFRSGDAGPGAAVAQGMFFFGGIIPIALVALPHWSTALLLVVNIVVFTIAARSDETAIAGSPLAADYAAYRQRAGMFWPAAR